jgi:hypothetical protein
MCSNMRMCQLGAEEAGNFLAGQQHTPTHIAHLTSGPVVAVELMAPSGIRKWLDMAGASSHVQL